MIAVELHKLKGAVDTAVDEAIRSGVVTSIWNRFHSVWKPDPNEISNRLGWLDMPAVMPGHVAEISDFVRGVRADGYTTAMVLGMGGSSLAPEVFAKTFDQGDGLELFVLDSTDPDRVLAYAEQVDLAKTLFLVATKSGGTVETLSFFKYFYNATVTAVGAEAAGKHFVAITDPGSKLETLAEKHGFRHTFLNNPNIGGRYSALSYFGLVPAALVGVDLDELLERAQETVNTNRFNGKTNEALLLGTAMGVLAKQGIDKLTFIISPAVASFGDWAEQLIAESTGKDGMGVLPVVGEPIGDASTYKRDRFFVCLQVDGDEDVLTKATALAAAGHPLVTVHLTDTYDLGGQYFLWMLATAIAGHTLDIQPFDQPNVESAKILARQMVAAYMEEGALPEAEAAPVTSKALADFLKQSNEGDYVAIHAYVEPTATAEAALQSLRLFIRDKHKVATTLGYGPRFLHSTGQLHKGDGGNGLFIQITTDGTAEVPIPDEAGEDGSTMSFGVLKMAPALGDGAALREAERRVIRFHVENVVAAVATLTE